MTVVDDDTVDAIWRAIESLTSLKSGTPLANMVHDNLISPNGDKNQLEIIGENAELLAVPTEFNLQNKQPQGFAWIDKIQQMVLSVFLNCQIGMYLV